MKIKCREHSTGISACRKWAIASVGIVALALGVLVVMVGLGKETNVELRPWLLAAGLFVVFGLYGVLKLPGSKLALRGACLLIFVACAAYAVDAWGDYRRRRSNGNVPTPFPMKPSVVLVVVGLPCLVFACTGYIRGLDEEEDEIRDIMKKNRLTNR